MSDGGVRRLSSRVVYTNRWMTVREDEIELPDGSPGLYGVVEKRDFALVIPAERDGFHLVEQYRYPVGRRTWEFPQGTVNGVSDLAEVARVELAEETGLAAASMRLLGMLDAANGYSTQRFGVFLATELTPGTPHPDLDEISLRHAFVTSGELERRIAAGAVTDSPTLAAYGLLRLATPVG